MQLPRHVSLNDLVAHWLPCVLELEGRCAWKVQPRYLPLVAQTSRGGARETLGHLLGRLRCGECDSRPVRIALREAIIRPGAKAPELGWSFPLPLPVSTRQPICTDGRGWRIAEPVEGWYSPAPSGK